MDDSITIRDAVPADAPAVREVGLVTWPPTYGPIMGDAYVADGLERYWGLDFIERLIAEGRVSVAATADGAVVGMTSVSPGEDGIPVMWKLYVHPDHHGKGVGSALLRAAFARAARTSDRLRLDVLDGNDAAHAFYKAKGFRETGRSSDEENPEWPDTVWMEAPV
ncbi:GNAT family N-acetyltransferase [Streptomyces sp. A7024]|uniref:GNAT family N-acetyltransferase n=1 Tax=Streptomyces coryli TaxID=1128680 RepID=A0A6G4UB78_9ACTN|nr:GNAT family N-acetyltransferase [Streptomyces coryli]NGN69479.1 GNAT family N-acetyltransferase [Streptomyces coryli]